MSQKSKKGDPSSRAKSTSTLNSAPTHTQPLPPHPSLSSFNASRTHFAAVVSAGIAGGQRLRCWDVERSSIVKEWDLPLDVKEAKRGARAVFWTKMSRSALVTSGEAEAEEDGSSKKRRKRKSASGQAGSGAGEDDEVEYVVVVQAASLLYYTAGQAGVKPVKIVPLSTTPSSAVALNRGQEHHIITVSSTSLEIVDPATGSVQLSTPLPDGFTPASTSTSTSTPIVISVLDDSTDHVNIAIASTNLTVLTLPLPLSTSSKGKVEWTRPQSISIEPIRTIVALPLEGTRFITVEEESRVGTVWAVTSPTGSQEQNVETIATIPSPSSEPIHNISLASSSGSDVEVEMYATSLSGEISIYSLTASSFTLSSSAEQESAGTSNSNSLSSKKKRSKKSAPVAALKPVSKVSVIIPSQGNEDVVMRILACVSSKSGSNSGTDEQDGAEGMDVDGEQQQQEEVVVGWMGGVGRVRWEKIRYREIGGGYIPEVVVKRSGQELIASESAEGTIPLQRFKESTAGANNNATRALMTEEEKNLAQKDLELPVEGDLADLTLGERLAVLEPDHAPSGARSERRARKPDGGDADDVEEEEEEGQDGGQKLGPQSTQSLTRLLLQALHTSDPSLLTLILTSPQNSTPGMIRNTIRKLPASMALPLLKACVERLGKGRGFERRGGGRGGGLSGKEGGCVVAWIRGVLVERGSILMTIPSLPVHLASLSQLLQSRLQLHTPLLSLSGRLDLALAQIELRKSLVPPKPKRQGTFYVEGESETDDDDEDLDDDEDMDSDVEIEGDEEDIGEVEDVRLESRRETESRSAGGDDDETDGEIRVRALNGRQGKASRELLVASDEEDEEEDEEDEDELDDDDEDDFDEDDDSEDGRPRGLIDDEADEASDDEDDDEDMEE